MRRTKRPFPNLAVPAVLVAVAVGTLSVALPLPASAATGLSSRTAKGSGALLGPRTSRTQDNVYLADVTKADEALIPYVQKRGNVALRALLTDGAAFCALLSRGGGIDNALTSLAVGARSVESQTHLPLKVATFNTMEAVALLTLCPAEQKLIPASDRARIRSLGQELTKAA